jgi:hypothetical protein
MPVILNLMPVILNLMPVILNSIPVILNLIPVIPDSNLVILNLIPVILNLIQNDLCHSGLDPEESGRIRKYSISFLTIIGLYE